MAPAAARVALESLLRERKLDTTLTTALPLEWTGGDACAPTGLPSPRRPAAGRRAARAGLGNRRATILGPHQRAPCVDGDGDASGRARRPHRHARSVRSRVGRGGGRRPRASPVGAGTGRAVDAVGARARLGAVAAAIRPHARQRGRPGARPGHQGRQPRAPVGRVRARGPRHRRRAARCVARAAVQHLDAAAAGRRRERHRVRARGRCPECPERQRREHPAAAAAQPARDGSVRPARDATAAAHGRATGGGMRRGRSCRHTGCPARFRRRDRRRHAPCRHGKGLRPTRFTRRCSPAAARSCRARAAAA